MVRETFSEVTARLRSGEESSGQSGLLKGAKLLQSGGNLLV